MKTEKIKLGELTLVGLTARTNNKNEMNPKTSKIGTLAGSYWGNQVANNIKHRINPGITYAVYTEFDSDENGDHTYFIGEAVSSIENQDLSQFKIITISKSHYQKFTTPPGKMPDVVISAWQKIWAMGGGKRKYIADFEVYGERASDPNNTVIDIYIGTEA
ncbi:MAG TPA: effector binding domain-containing protein [Gammaproteobacteria bacterium]|nr:effector binding domain-containing protein [Gammaproteobacteria bacterium]